MWVATRLVIVFVVILTGRLALAADWQVLYDNKSVNETMSVDRTSLMPREGGVKTILWEVSAQKTQIWGETQIKFKSARFLTAYKCEAKQYSDLSISLYTGENGTGTTTATLNLENWNEQWKDIPPHMKVDSNTGLVFNLVCKNST